ncbi:hypothetical protein I4U23_000052 [Adineta vaga]|nr:hypothetical protein I4U23_000052 [Adineta vaga]
MSEKITNDIAEKLWKDNRLSLPVLESQLSSEPINSDRKLIELCLQIPKPEIIEEEKDFDINIVWLKNPNQNEEIIDELDIQIFDSNDELFDFLTEIQTNNIFLIINRSKLQHILSFLDDLIQIIFIYIFIEDTEIYDVTSILDTKRTIRKISNNKDELFRSIHEDILICEKGFLLTNTFDLFIAEQSTDHTKNTTFIWYHLLINTLFDLGVYHQTAKTDLVNYCREQCKNNDSNQRKITEFENQYKSTDAIRWYTHDSFIYRLLNKALRTRDIDAIFKFRFFIIDFQNQLELFYNEEYMEFITFVYRDQAISDIELKKLKKSIGKFISINTYFSASINKVVALEYALHTSSILFEIDMKNVLSIKNKRIRPVYVQDKSYFPDELEVIFPIGSTFKVDSIDIDNSPRRIRLILTEDEDYERIVLFADLLISMGDYDKAKQYLQILIEELHRSNDMINNGYAYCSMGKIYDANGDYNCALVWFNKALNLIEKDNAFCARYIFIWQNHIEIKRYRSDLADVYDEFGNIYNQMHDFKKALEYYSHSLNIRQLNQSNYREYILTYLSLILLYFNNSNYHEALQHLKKLLPMLLNTVLKNHPDVIFIYTFIGIIYNNCEDNQSALIYCEKALYLIENLSKTESINPIIYIVLYTTLSSLSEYIDDQLHYVQKALNIYKKFINIISKTDPILFNLYNQLGVTYYRLYDFSSALDYFLCALETDVEVERRVLILVNIANTCNKQNNGKKALQYLNEAHKISSESNQTKIGEIYSEYSRLYEIENNLEKAIFYAEESLEFNEIHHNIDDLVDNYLRLSDLCPDKKSIYMKKIEEILEENDLSSSTKFTFHYMIASYFKHENDLINALKHYQLSLEYALKNIPTCYFNLIDLYANIGFIYKEMEDFDNALNYFVKSCEIYWQLSNLTRLPYKDKIRMLSTEGYLIENVQECSLLTKIILLIYYEIEKIYIDRKENELVLKYIQQTQDILKNYCGKKDISKNDYFYYLFASIYHSINDIDQALYYYEKSVELFTTNCTLYGITYYVIGAIYLKQRNYLMSLSKCKISLTFLYNSQVVDHTQLRSVNYCVAETYSLMNNSEYALIYSEQTIKYCLLQNPINYEVLMQSYHTSARHLINLRPWDRKNALNYISKAEELTQYSSDDEFLRNFYCLAGRLYWENEEFEKSLIYFNKVSKQFIEIDYITLLICLLYMMMGDLDTAFNIIKQSIDRISNMDTIDWINLSQLYINMSMIHYERGEYQLTLEYNEKTLNMLEKNVNDQKYEYYESVYNQMALILFSIWKFERCKNMDNQSYSLINVNITLGLIECQLENYYLALDYFGQSWEFIYNRHLDACSIKINLYNHIGYVYYKLGQISLAMKYYLKTLSLYYKYPKHFDLAEVYKNIALIYEHEYHNYSLALTFYQRALECVPTKKHPHYILYKNMIQALKKKIPRKCHCLLIKIHPLPKHLQADVVYSVNCNDCGHTYVGKTIRQPIRRLKEHGAPNSIFQQAIDPSRNKSSAGNAQAIHALLHQTTENISTTIGPIREKQQRRRTPYPTPTVLKRSERIQA